MTRPSVGTLATVILVTVVLVALPASRPGVGLTGALSALIPFVTAVAIFGIVSIGLNVQWGYTGIFNFGVVAFFMVGAYTAAIFTKGPSTTEYVQYVGGYGELLSPPGWLPFVVGVLMAALVSALLALLLAIPTLRLRDDYLAITTIGVAEIARRVTIEERWLVNGSRGLTGIPQPFEDLVSREMQRPVMLLVAVATLIATFLLVEGASRSPWGRVLRALRDDEDATAASGKNVFAFRMQGFVFGAAIMGVGGAMFGFYQGSVSPDAFTHFFGTFIIWAMLIVGGSGNNVGAVVGAYIVWAFWNIALYLQSTQIGGEPLLPAFLQERVFFIRDFLIGTLIVAVLLIKPKGLLPEEPRVSRWLVERVKQLGPPPAKVD